MTSSKMRVEIANFVLDDLSALDLVDSLSIEKGVRRVAIGIHITTLNATIDSTKNKLDFSKIDFVYPDGWSVYLLGKLNGMRELERIATTDLYPRVLNGITEPKRIAFLGGDESLGPLLLKNWHASRPNDICTFSHGYQENWLMELRKVVLSEPDICFIGLGMPLELEFVNTYFEELPKCLILTCGGMLRILAGVEKRAPKFLQITKLEWFYRLITSPRRTTKRYLIGFINLLRVLVDFITGVRQ